MDVPPLRDFLARLKIRALSCGRRRFREALKVVKLVARFPVSIQNLRQAGRVIFPVKRFQAVS